jgi:hypothetical protein
MKQGTHRADSLIPNDTVLMRMMVCRQDPQLNIASNSWQEVRDGILHIPKVSPLVEVKISTSVQKNPHTGLTRDRIQE